MSVTIEQEIKLAIEKAIPGSKAEVYGAGGHFQISVIAEQFAGKNTLAKQRLVYEVLTPFMSGGDAPVHAVDTLVTRTP